MNQNNQRGRRRISCVMSLLLAAAVTGSCGKGHEETAAEQTPAGETQAPAPETTTSLASHVYTLPENSASLYPDQSWLPEAYKKDYPDLAATITRFTQQSLDRGGIDARVTGVTAAGGAPEITLSGADVQSMQDFAGMHQSFLSATHALAGLDGAGLCQATEGCWDPKPKPDNPWAFYLPLGLPMLNQKAVLFLNYPPNDSLEKSDYLDNFTMRRWTDVLVSAGIDAPLLYETIVDARPIAAPGSGQASYMPDIETYFNAPDSDHYYVTPLLTLLTNPIGNDSESSLPVMILGTPSREAWADIIGEQGVSVLDVGIHSLPGSGKPTAWVAANHPDVTAYQCCPGDPSPACCSDSFGCSEDLVEDEVIDLQAACIIKALGENPAADPQVVKAGCASEWKTNPPAGNLQTICVRAKLDYSYDSPGICKSEADALAFCAHYGNEACPGGVFNCEVP